jgi:hypothetical protein
MPIVIVLEKTLYLIIGTDMIALNRKNMMAGATPKKNVNPSKDAKGEIGERGVLSCG